MAITKNITKTWTEKGDVPRTQPKKGYERTLVLKRWKWWDDKMQVLLTTEVKEEGEKSN